MEPDAWVLLETFNDENEANIIESLLTAEGISVLKKYRDIGDYLKIYMGMTSLGVDLMVPLSQHDQAVKVLAAAESFTGFQENEDFQELETNLHERIDDPYTELKPVRAGEVAARYGSQRKKRTLVLIAFLAIPLIIMYLIERIAD